MTSRSFLPRALLGPLAYFPGSWRAGLGLLLLIGLLTGLTQIGGLLLWGLLPLLDKLRALVRPRGRWLTGLCVIASFAAVYLFVALALVPPLAALAGRHALPCFASERLPFGAASAFYCAANRRYAVSGVSKVLAELSRDLAARFPGSRVGYLDAGFPFFDGFALPPHLSHDDGRKIDLAFFYRDAQGRSLARAGAWPLGYWAYSAAVPGEPLPCAGRRPRLSLRWDMAWLQPLFSRLTLDQERTAALVTGLLRRHEVRKIFLEPHLTRRLGLTSDRIRFQGCRAARHDDHLHVEFRF